MRAIILSVFVLALPLSVHAIGYCSYPSNCTNDGRQVSQTWSGVPPTPEAPEPEPDPDTDAPTPNPMTFVSIAALDHETITMTATTATDDSGPVEYIFDCVQQASPGDCDAFDSSWQESTTYEVSGLSPSSEYTYTIQARDSIPNTGTASSTSSVETDAAPSSSLNLPSSHLSTWYPATAAEAGYAAAQSWAQYDATCECADDSCVADGAGSGCTPASGTIAFPASWSCGVANDADELGSETTDWQAISCLLAAAPNESVIYLPDSGDATYDMSDQQQEIIDFQDSNRVLRCENTDVRIEMTTANIGGDASCGNVGLSSGNVCKSRILSMGKAGTGTSTPWGTGFTIGETAIGVTSAAGFSEGDWAVVRIADVGHAGRDQPSTKCENHLDVGGNGADSFNYALMGVHKIDSIDGNTINIERGLRIDYTLSGTDCTDEGIVYPFAPLENVGVENCTFTSDSGINQAEIDSGGGIPFIGLGGIVNSWVVGNVLERAERKIFGISISSRNWIQGNTFRNYGNAIDQASTSGFHVWRGSMDDVFENNVFQDFSMGFYINHGPHNPVIAYNFMGGGTGGPRGEVERGIFIHGMYPSNILSEGNDLDTSISWDNVWGAQGPRSGFYRNRVRDIGVNAENGRDSSIGTNKDGEGDGSIRPIGDEFWVIGNTSGYLYASYRADSDDNSLGSTQDVDYLLQGGDFWLEKNMFRVNNTCTGTPNNGECVGGDEPGSLCTDVGDCAGASSSCDEVLERCGFVMFTPEATTSCGTVAGDCLTGAGPNGILGNNYGGDSASADHQDDDAVPTSFYRDSKPSWWCDEACPWDGETGIGAWGDDFGGVLCKLPAEILKDGTTCTLP